MGFLWAETSPGYPEEAFRALASAFRLRALPLPAVMGRLTAALSGDEESPGNAEHLAS